MWVQTKKNVRVSPFARGSCSFQEPKSQRRYVTREVVFLFREILYILKHLVILFTFFILKCADFLAKSLNLIIVLAEELLFLKGHIDFEKLSCFEKKLSF